MLLPAMRPPLLMTVPLSRAESTARLQAILTAPGSPCVGTVASGHVSLVIARPQRRLFSPSLDLHLYDDPNGTRLDGRFGPHPDVWTLYVALYALLIAGFLGVSMLGSAHWVMQQSPRVLLLLPVLVGMGGLLYLSALIGQRLAADQMQLIDDVLHHALDLPAAGSGESQS